MKRLSVNSARKLLMAHILVVQLKPLNAWRGKSQSSRQEFGRWQQWLSGR